MLHLDTAQSGPRPFRLRDGLLGALIAHEVLLVMALLVWRPVARPPGEGFAGRPPLKLVFAPAPEPAEQVRPPDDRPSAASRQPEPPSVAPTPRTLKAVSSRNRRRSTYAVGRSGAGGRVVETPTGTEGTREAPYRVGQQAARTTAAKPGRGNQAPTLSELGSTGPTARLPMRRTAEDVAQASAPAEWTAPATDESQPAPAPESETADAELWRESMRPGDTLAGEPGSEAVVQGQGEPVTAQAAEPATASLAGPPTSGPAVSGRGERGTGEYAVLKKAGYRKRGKTWPE
jgi:hypothetical protein